MLPGGGGLEVLIDSSAAQQSKAEEQLASLLSDLDWEGGSSVTGSADASTTAFDVCPSQNSCAVPCIPADVCAACGSRMQHGVMSTSGTTLARLPPPLYACHCTLITDRYVAYTRAGVGGPAEISEPGFELLVPDTPVVPMKPRAPDRAAARPVVQARRHESMPLNVIYQRDHTGVSPLHAQAALGAACTQP
jgi:hypothetical protein